MLSNIKITKEIVEASSKPNQSVSRHQSYFGCGHTRMERRTITSESDFSNEAYRRFSKDNGQTWGDWEDIYQSVYVKKGNDEMTVANPTNGLYNPVHDHYVTVLMQRIFDGGHKKAYEKYWKHAKRGFHDHCFLFVSKDLKKWNQGQLIKYEQGADYDENRWNDPDYLWNNDAYVGSNLQILDDGDILFSVGANVASCAAIRGLDIQKLFPSCPQIMKGLIVIRGAYDEKSGSYELHYSKPIVISDLKSSRGVDEPIVYKLSDQRVIAVFRGSNIQTPNWNTRIEQGTPAHKWFCYSDDNAKSFTEPVPWHYDTGEVFYSPATISRFFYSTKKDRLYWLGNITGPDAYGNSPRYPLVMCEVDRETGLLIRKTLTVIDDRQPLVDSEKMQLSNFSVLEDRITKNLEIYVTRLGANPDDFWRSDAYRYTVSFES